MTKILVLTTKTLHHNFFCYELNKKYSFDIIFETRKIKSKYKTYHSYFKQRDKLEKKKFFKNKKIKLSVKNKFYNLNKINCINYIKKIRPTHILCFGISKLEKKFIDSFPKALITNLHGGDPEYYRGLDGLLWSIYDNKFSKLYTTHHVLQTKLDTGPIIYKKKIKIPKNFKLEKLRYLNTINCVDLIDNYFKKIHSKKIIYSKKQKKLGKYFTFFPSSKINDIKKNIRKRLK